MPTALVITATPDYGARCFDAFRTHGLFPVVVATLEQGVPLLKQFRVDVLAVHSPDSANDASIRTLLAAHAPGTPTIVLRELTVPHVLAVQLRDAIRAGVQREVTTPRQQTAGGSPASSSSRGASSA